jgi:hypothetical protein
MVWFLSRVPKGCALVQEDRRAVLCHSKASLHRTKALANLQFGWWLYGVRRGVLHVRLQDVPGVGRVLTCGCR